MKTARRLQRLAARYGTPILVMDHDRLRANLAAFRRHLPRVQPYYAVKANPEPAIIQTFYEEGAGFDVASQTEFDRVFACIRHLPAPQRRQWIWNKVIYANPIKMAPVLRALNRYRVLVTFDNAEEIRKVRRYAPHARMVLRLAVPDTGAVCELSSKCGAAPDEAIPLMLAAQRAGLKVEGISFHVGSQTTHYENFALAINLAAHIFQEARQQGCQDLHLLDIGGGFPAPYDDAIKPFTVLAKIINTEIDRLLSPEIRIMAEPGRFLVATAGTAVVSIIGKSRRNGKCCYYIDDGVYHTFSGIVFDHGHYRFKAMRRGRAAVCTVFGPTCDALDVVSVAERLPETLRVGDRLYSENIGAYSNASATHFNGIPPARVVHINTRRPPECDGAFAASLARSDQKCE